MIDFKIKNCCKNARTGEISTAHGKFQTPAFMPVGTAATVKAMKPYEVKKTGAEIILGNTYHLMLRPTAERIAELGGLHKFMNWNAPILTDSGGFQVMSLAKLRKINEEGVIFQSHLDGETINLTPESSIEIQHLLGSDITMAFDECTPFPASFAEAENSMLLSMRWAERSKKAYKQRAGYGLFGIVQGGIYPELRDKSAVELTNIGFDGYAIGGLAVGEGQELMVKTLKSTIPHLPAKTPRYLMGVGKPDDILLAVLEGVDMFDCVIPTRSGRNARAYTFSGEQNIRNARFASDANPLEPECPCTLCTEFSNAYLHHLFKADEMLGPILLTEHNLTFYQRLMHGIRSAISQGNIENYASDLIRQFGIRRADV